MLVDAAIGMMATQGLDQAGIPASVHQSETPGVEEQRQLVEPLEKVMPVGRVMGELGQGFVDQPGMPRGVLADKLLAAFRWSRGTPAQGIEFMVAHQATRLAGLDHVMHDVQGFANARAAVDDVAQEQCHALWVAPYAALTAITEHVQQVLKGMGATVHVTDQVVTSRGIEHQSPPPPSRLPQPSLVRQTS
ncbi:hypothetical protein D3C80_1351460 [compost metagenome]